MLKNAIALMIASMFLLTACERTVQGPGLAEIFGQAGQTMGVSNGLISLELTPDAALTARQGSKTFFEGIDLAKGDKIERIERVAVSDLLGDGRALRVHYASGRMDDLAVYDHLEFMSITFAAKEDVAGPINFTLDFGRGPYCGYDDGRNKYFLQSTLYTRVELNPGQRRQLSIRGIANEPVLLSSTRTAEGVADVGHEVWDDENLLTGVSDIKAGEDYELRILAGVFYDDTPTLSDEDRAAGVKMWINKSGPFYRAIITSPEDRRVKWAIEFRL